MISHLRATRCHLPYGITQFYLPPDTSVSTTDDSSDVDNCNLLDMPNNNFANVIGSSFVMRAARLYILYKNGRTLMEKML